MRARAKLQAVFLVRVRESVVGDEVRTVVNGEGEMEDGRLPAQMRVGVLACDGRGYRSVGVVCDSGDGRWGSR